MKRHGFTLIELLIVVAIIAILAAIAVPNFLEAQVRAKVSRTDTDHRTLSVAIEAYAVDNRVYPIGEWCATQAGTVKCVPTVQASGGQQYPWAQAQLTTPIAYMTSILVDPFGDKGGKTNKKRHKLYPNEILLV